VLRVYVGGQFGDAVLDVVLAEQDRAYHLLKRGHDGNMSATLGGPRWHTALAAPLGQDH
jgi:hypothetical protein